MKSRWIVVADRTQAHVFSENKGELTEHSGLLHSQSRLQDRELENDKQGRASFAGESLGGHGYAAHSDAHDREAEIFAKEIVTHLHDLEKHNQLASLILVAEPRMLGFIETALPKSLQACLQSTVRKDLCHIPRAELLLKLKELL